LDREKLIRDGIATRHEYRAGEHGLRRGDIGCSDSHLRLWKHISDNNIPRALILEDDADFRCNERTVQRIQRFCNDLDRLKLDYDLLNLGHIDRVPPERVFAGTEIGVARACQGCFTYVVTLEGARKLIAGALPMNVPVDEYVYARHNDVRQFVMEPRLNWVVPIESSDTNNVW